MLAVLAEVRRTSEAEVEARDGPFITSRQAWIISMLVIGWIANGGASLFKISLLNYVAIVLLSVGLVAFIVTALPGIRRAPGYFKGLEDETMGDVGRNLTRWYRTVRQIRQGYSAEQIRFAQEYLKAVAGDARVRLSMVVGALDKVGLIPLGVTGMTALVKLTAGQSGPAWFWYTIALIVLLMYAAALKLTDVAFALERFALILRCAGEGESSGEGESPAISAGIVGRPHSQAGEGARSASTPSTHP